MDNHQIIDELKRIIIKVTKLDEYSERPDSQYGQQQEQWFYRFLAKVQIIIADDSQIYRHKDGIFRYIESGIGRCSANPHEHHEHIENLGLRRIYFCIEFIHA